MPFLPLLFGFLVAACIGSLASFFLFSGSRVRERLGILTKPGLRPAADDSPVVLPPALVEKFEKKLGIRKDSSKAKELKKQMVQAGIYSDRALSIFLGMKVGLPLALPILIMPLLWGRGISKILLVGIAYALFVGGYFLPSLFLGRLVNNRQNKIRQALPDALDLLVVCVEAGQGLNAALKRVSDDFMVSCPALAKELNIICHIK